MNLQPENKIALATGSTAGIGFAIAKALAIEGASVIINGRTEARVAEAIASIRADLARSKNATVTEMEREFFHTARPGSLLQRFATTEEIAALVAFVSSPLSAATNGAALRVEDGVVRSIL